MIIVQIVMRKKGETQKTLWQMLLPEHDNTVEVMELLTKSILSVIKKLMKES